MTTAQLKKILVKKINKIEDDDFLNAVKVILDIKESNIGVYKLNPIQKKLIQQSEKDFKEGRVYTNEEVFKEIDEWLKEM